MIGVTEEQNKPIDSIVFIFGLIKNGDLEKIVKETVQKKSCTFEEANYEVVHESLTNLFKNQTKDINLMEMITTSIAGYGVRFLDYKLSYYMEVRRGKTNTKPSLVKKPSLVIKHSDIIKKEGTLSKEEIKFLIPKLAAKLGQVIGTDGIEYQIHYNRTPK